MGGKTVLLGILLVAISSLVLLGCPPRTDQAGSGSGSGTSAPNEVASGETVAKVGATVISLSDFEAQLNQQNPLIRARYKSLEQKKKLLENLVEREAMVAEAKRLGLDQDPEMIRGYKKILARHLVNVEFNKKRVKEIQVSDEEIQRYYDENSDRYHSPEKVRVHHILMAVAPGDSAKLAAARTEAQGLLKQLQAQPNDRRLFLELARKHSQDEATRNVGGDTNFKTRDRLVEAYGKTFADAAFGLKKANDLSGLVETDKGVHILRQSGRQAAIDLPLEKVKGQIRTTLFARARGEAYKQFVEEIKKKVGVELFDEVVSKAKVDMSGSPGAGKQMPGGIQGPRPPNHPQPGSMRPGSGKTRPGAGMRPPRLPTPGKGKPGQGRMQIRPVPSKAPAATQK